MAQFVWSPTDSAATSERSFAERAVSAFGLGVVREALPLATKGDRLAYKVTTDSETAVVKAAARQDSPEKIARDLFCLRHLARFDLPVPRLLLPPSGDPLVDVEGRSVYAYRYIEGHYPRPDAAFFAALGSLLARVHLVPSESYPYPSCFTPDAILPFVKENLPRVALPHQTVRVAEVLAAIDAFPSFDDLPRAIIHSDPYFSNIVQSDERVSFIDLDDAGVAPALVDVGYVLAHCCTTHPGDRIDLGIGGDGILWHRAWAEAFLGAYQELRPLNSQERAHLGAAAEFALMAYIADWEGGENHFDVNEARYRLVVAEVPGLL